MPGYTVEEIIYRCFDCPKNIPDVDSNEATFLTLNEAYNEEDHLSMQHDDVPSWAPTTFMEVWGLCSKHNKTEREAIEMMGRKR